MTFVEITLIDTTGYRAIQKTYINTEFIHKLVRDGEMTFIHFENKDSILVVKETPEKILGGIR